MDSRFGCGALAACVAVLFQDLGGLLCRRGDLGRFGEDGCEQGVPALLLVAVHPAALLQVRRRHGGARALDVAQQP